MKQKQIKIKNLTNISQYGVRLGEVFNARIIRGLAVFFLKTDHSFIMLTVQEEQYD